MSVEFDDEKTITLRKPITIGSGESAITYTELKLREPLSGELEKASRADTGTGVVINLVAAIAKVPRAVAEKISQRDLAEVNEYLSLFTDAGTLAAGQS